LRSRNRGKQKKPRKYKTKLFLHELHRRASIPEACG
jgi:hypothetical protein